MHVGITWSEITLRLACAAIAGTLIGINRGEHGRAAGLRTTLLVCMAAALAMIQASLLLGVNGKSSDSFAVMDVMRLPLGILSGMGFIGAGAILKRGNSVLGITTAATLWFVTVMGLCFGGGQIALGLIALAMGLVILSGLKWVEERWTQDRRATLTIVTGTNGPAENEIVKALNAANYKIGISSIIYGENGVVREITCLVRWRGRAHLTQSPEPIKQLAARFHFLEMDWRMEGR
jgi:putative Mg2+ transporter-C (MgtC) family protein